MVDDPIPRLLPTLRALNDWFAATKTPYLVIGGVAVSLIGRARTTRDVDSVILVDENALTSFIESGAEFGFVPRIADPVGFARRSRMLLLVHKPAGTKTDISLGELPFEKESISRGVPFRAGDVELRIPTVEDLIIMKAIASRPNDLADIATLLEIHPAIDRRRIRRWVRDFADTLEAPEIAERLETLLTARRKPQGRKKKRPK